MEKFFKLTIVLILWTIGCQGQRDLTVGQLYLRVQELEKAVGLLPKLGESQSTRTISTNVILPNQAKRGFMNHMYPADGFTLPGNEVGFHVSLTDDVKLGFGMKLKFDTVVENIGGAYNKDTAEFICPVSGTYLISLNIACQKDSYVEVSVEIRNGFDSPRYVLNTVCDQRKRTLIGGGSLYCGNTQNGGTTIVSLKQNDKVTVNKIWPVGGESTIFGKGFSTFSGYLLRQS